MELTDTKSKILRGATELFLRYGIRSVSMDNIANHLGVSKKTLYQFFKDKNEMVFSVTEAHLLRDREELDQIAKEAKNAVEEMVKLSACLRQNFRNMNPSLLFDLQKYHHDAWNLWIQYKNELIRSQIVRSINQGKEEGYFRAEINTDIISILRLETIQLPFDPAVFPKDRYELTDVQMQIFEHFLYGLFTEKGKKLYEKYKQKINPQENSTIQL
ncbi:MAG: TetR/AcrR family transcriptional regulator [Cyclobacteriaceae bacterium]|nr:TetR/AcrR family transcriptional regulator [Cyclobacteriaceae bacterium]